MVSSAHMEIICKHAYKCGDTVGCTLANKISEDIIFLRRPQGSPKPSNAKLTITKIVKGTHYYKCNGQDTSCDEFKKV